MRENYIIKLRKMVDGGMVDAYYTGYVDRVTNIKPRAFKYKWRWLAEQVARQFLERNDEYSSYYIEKEKVPFSFNG